MRYDGCMPSRPTPCVDCGRLSSPVGERCASCAQKFRWKTNGASDPRRAHLANYHGGRELPRPYEDREWLRRMYQDDGMGLKRIAVEAQCAMRTIARWMKIHEIPTDPNRRPPRRFGSDHPSWKGGPPTCEKCGEPKGFYARHCMGCRDYRGEKHPQWRGEDVEYTAVHGRLVSERGPASTHRCQHCSGEACEWAYDHEDPNERRNRRGREEGPYSLDPARYMPLCVRCHRKFDSPRAVHRRRPA